MDKYTVEQRKIISCTDDKKFAEKYDMCLRIKTLDDKIVYASKSVFIGIEYFDKIFNSGMAETKTNEILFDYLVSENVKKYIDLLTEFNVKNIVTLLNELSQDDVLSIYSQLNYHQITSFNIILADIINSYPVSRSLYEWNALHNIVKTERIYAYETMKKCDFDLNFYKEGDFSFHHDTDDLTEMYEALTKNNLWHHCDNIIDAACALGEKTTVMDGHSGNSANFCLRTMVYIHIKGWNNYIADYFEKSILPFVENSEGRQ
jgi:hypothetical protein